MTNVIFKFKIKYMKKIILASSSPRRKEILAMCGLDFDVMPSDCDENIRADSPEELVLKLSQLKCSDVAGRAQKDRLVVGADTIVVFEGLILGKPADGADAFRMLRALSGNTHTVYTGVSIKDTDTGKNISFYEQTDVTMYGVPDEILRRYIETGEPMDKAGAYGIQGKGAFLVKKIDGDFYTVMGFPISHFISTLYDEFR